MSRRTTRGFTLIEVMIVVVIIGILAGIAYPSYKKYTTQSRRSDAQIALTRVAAQQEKFFSDCGWYASVLTASGGSRTCGSNKDSGFLGLNSTSSPQSHYTLSAVTKGNTTGTCTGGSAEYTCGFTVVASPTPGGQQAGDGNFRIDALGTKAWAKDGVTYSYKWTDK